MTRWLFALLCGCRNKTDICHTPDCDSTSSGSGNPICSPGQHGLPVTNQPVNEKILAWPVSAGSNKRGSLQPLTPRHQHCDNYARFGYNNGSLATKAAQSPPVLIHDKPVTHRPILPSLSHSTTSLSNGSASSASSLAVNKMDNLSICQTPSSSNSVTDDNMTFYDSSFEKDYHEHYRKHTSQNHQGFFSSRVSPVVDTGKPHRSVSDLTQRGRERHSPVTDSPRAFVHRARDHLPPVVGDTGKQTNTGITGHHPTGNPRVKQELHGGECCTDERYNGHQDTGRFRHAPHLSPTGASDEDEVSTHTAALSDTTRSKARLLAKRNEFRREVDRKNQLQQQMRTHGRRGVMNNSMPSLTTGSGAAAGSALHDPAVRPRQTVRSHTLANHRQSGVAAAGKSAGPAAHPTLMKKSKTFGGDLSKSLNASGPSVNLFDGSLTTFASPKAALEMAYVKLASSEWDTAVSGLTDIVRLVRYHPAVIVGDVKTVTAAVVRQCRNLRSQVMRTAIQTTTELFEHIGRALEPELASLVEILMLRTSDTNRFIRADSSRALDVMLEQVSVPRAVACVTHTGVTHRSAQVRCTTARLLAQLVARVGPQRALTPGTVERLIPAAAQLTRQGDLQTRQYAKMIFRELLSHPDLDKILSRHLQDSVYRDIVKLVDNLQNEVNNSHTGAQSRLNQTM